MSEHVKKFAFSINTQQGGISEFETPVLNGELEYVYVSATQPINLDIDIKELDTNIFFIKGFQGQKIFFIRVKGIESDGFASAVPTEKIAINHSLLFRLNGPKNTRIEFEVVYS